METININFSPDEINEIEFDEKEERYGSTFLRFSGPRTIFGDKFKDADYADISIKLENMSVIVGPASIEEEGTWIYDQIDAELSNEDLLFLLNKAGITTEDISVLFLHIKKQPSDCFLRPTKLWAPNPSKVFNTHCFANIWL